MCAYDAEISDHQIFQFHEYQMRADLPNLMLIKVICTCYRKSGNFRYKNIFVVDGGYEN